MALSRRFLTALGLEGDKVDEIINAHAETVNALKKERDDAKEQAESYKDDLEKFKADAEKVSGLEKEIENLKKAAEDAEKNNGEETWKVKYEALVEEKNNLQAEYDKFKDDTTAEKTKIAKEKVYRALLKEAGVSEKRIDSVIRVTDLSKIELDKEGNAKGADDIKESIKETWSDFIPVESEKGASTPTPPANIGGTAKTKKEIMAIKDRAERQKAIAENPKLFGIAE